MSSWLLKCYEPLKQVQAVYQIANVTFSYIGQLYPYSINNLSLCERHVKLQMPILKIANSWILLFTDFAMSAHLVDL